MRRPARPAPGLPLGATPQSGPPFALLPTILVFPMMRGMEALAYPAVHVVPADETQAALTAWALSHRDELLDERLTDSEARKLRLAHLALSEVRRVAA